MLQKQKENATKPHTIRGTPYYMAPEIYKPLIEGYTVYEYDPFKTDIYSNGQIFKDILKVTMQNDPALY